MKKMQSEYFFYDKVIIIDNSEIERLITSRMLKQHVFAREIIEFASAIDAIEFIRYNINNLQQNSLLILLDIHMPQMDGFEFIDAANYLLELLKEHCSIIIFSSSYDQNDIKRASGNLFVNKFMTKPLNIEKLKDITAGNIPALVSRIARS